MPFSVTTPILCVIIITEDINNRTRFTIIRIFMMSLLHCLLHLLVYHMNNNSKDILIDTLQTTDTDVTTEEQSIAIY